MSRHRPRRTSRRCRTRTPALVQTRADPSGHNSACCRCIIVAMTGEELRADPIELTHLADCFLQASQRIADDYRGLRDALSLPVGAFGDSEVGPRVTDTHPLMVEDV